LQYHYDPAAGSRRVTRQEPENAWHELDRALRFARSHLSPDITAQRLLILIAVYFNEGLSQRELLDHLESTSITALSRNLADLSTLTTKKLPGPGLLELRIEPMNLRLRRVFLTRKGHRFMRQWLRATQES
jgi:DNA-binding MarR family transcriptional regulator